MSAAAQLPHTITWGEVRGYIEIRAHTEGLIELITKTPSIKGALREDRDAAIRVGVCLAGIERGLAAIASARGEG